MDRTVEYHYRGIPEIQSNSTNLPIVINHTFSDTGDVDILANTTKTRIKGKVAIVHNHFHYKYETRLNYLIAYNQFVNGVMQFGRVSRISEKLNGRQLELHVENLPRTFFYNEEVINSFFIFSYHTYYFEESEENVNISYAITENGKTIKTGKVVIVDPRQMYAGTSFKNWRDAANNHLSKYDKFCNNLGSHVMSKILLDLSTHKTV